MSDRLFDDFEPADESWTPDEQPEPLEESLAFERYVSEGLTLLEEWMRDPF